MQQKIKDMADSIEKFEDRLNLRVSDCRNDLGRMQSDLREVSHATDIINNKISNNHQRQELF